MATDHDLVVRHVGGDRRALADIHVCYAAGIHDICVTMLDPDPDRDPDAAFRDTFLIAARRLEGLSDPSRLRSWLYAVARSRCLIRGRPRPPGGARRELAVLADRARMRYRDRDLETLDLHFRHGLRGDEIAGTTAVPAARGHKLVQRVRDRAERSLGPLVVADLHRGDCEVLARLVDGWSGRFSPIRRRRVARHVDDCVVCERHRREILAPGGLRAVVPLAAPAPTLTARLATDLGSVSEDPPPPPPDREPYRWRDDGFPAAARLLRDRREGPTR